MKINVLSLFSGIGGIKMGFSLERRKPTDIPMHRSEAPLELWDKHRDILKDHQHVYTDFTCENVDENWIVPVDIRKSRRFGLHYLRHRVRQYFESMDKLVVFTGKIQDIILYVKLNVQDVENAPSLYDFFTPEEYFDIWQIYNYKNYACDAPSPINGYAHAANAVPLLRNIIETADAAIGSGSNGATLRFGHDGNLIPLCGLLRIEGCIARETRPDHIYEAWTNFRIVPMAGNLQIVFFRNKKNPSDVIVKLMLNEHEVRIPIDSDMAPFYRWSDFRSYCVEAMTQAEAYKFTI